MIDRLAEDKDPVRLDGKFALVTGASTGIGRSIAESIGNMGATVLICSRREHAVRTAVEQMTAKGIRALGIPADVRDERAVNGLFEYARSVSGSLDILVNCAGGSFGEGFNRGPLRDAVANDLLEAFRLNVISSFLCARAATDLMAEKGGVIVNISSISGLRTPPEGMAAYGASKAALNSLTKSMAIEWAPDIRVNAIAPGYIDTERTTATRTKDRLERQLASVALGRLGSVEEVAALVTYLVSPAASWTTGVVYELDGGFKSR